MFTNGQSKTRGPEDLTALMGLVASAVLGLIIVTALYFGRDILVPVALAILLSFVLTPVVSILQSIHIPRSAAVISVVLIAFAIIFALGSLIATQLGQLAGDLPKYQSTIREKVQSLRGSTATKGTLERASDILSDLSKSLDNPKEGAAAKPPAVPPGAAPRPVPVTPVLVEVRQPDPGALENLRTLISPLLHPLATTGIIVIFVIFILLQREDLRNRLIRLAGSHDLQRTTAALDDAASRLSRLFLTQLFLNGAFGVAIGTGLWAIGVPSAVLWGILAGVLRFVPYIGAFIAAAFPLALSAAVDPGWTMLASTLVLFLVVEPILGHVIEPMAYGHSTGLSPVAVVVSASFWTALWGPIGLVLATPLTVCLVVLGRHVERLEFLDVMFGDRPALSPPEIFYQRMLAGDPSEAADKAEAFLKERPLAVYYDDIAVQGLRLAQNDAERGVLDVSRQGKLRDAVAEFVSEIDDARETAGEETIPTRDAEAAAALEALPGIDDVDAVPILDVENRAPGWDGPHPMVCIAGRSALDEAAALMVTSLAIAHGLAAKALPAESLSMRGLAQLETSGVALLCLSYVDVSTPAHMRYMVRRLKRRLPSHVKIILGCWGADLGPAEIEQMRDAAKADFGARRIREAVRIAIDLASGRAVETQMAGELRLVETRPPSEARA